jgi:LPS export ABC transporter protein LptC
MLKIDINKYCKKIIACFPIIIAGSMLLFISCKNDIKEVKQVTFDSKFPALKIVDMHTAITDSGRLKVVIDATIMQRFDLDKDAYDEYPEGIHVQMLENGKMVSEITSEYAIYHTEKELWEAKRNVIAENVVKHEKLNTEHLLWNMKEGKIYSDKFVRITTQDEVFFGTGFESNQDFTSLVITDPTGSFSIEENEKKK